MIKNFIFICFISLSFLNASIVQDKIQNIIGDIEYNKHSNLISMLFKQENKFVLNDKIKYYNVFNTLKQNGLLNLRLDKPQDITIEFRALNKSMKAFKILNDTIRAIGYRHILTKSLNKLNKNEFVWKIKFKAEYMIDPVVLLKELRLKSCKILQVINKGKHHWYYEIDFNDSYLREAYKVDKNEKVVFQKPLQEYFISVENIKNLQILSRKLNNWFPHIVFFDKNLKILEVIKKDRVYRGYKTKVPKSTKYIKITDLYNLINIKRGLSVIVR